VPRFPRPAAASLEGLLALALALAAVLGGITRALGPPWVLTLLAVAALLFVLGRSLHLEARALEAERRLDETAKQLDRRISELFSLQELSYVLSESMQLDRIVDQVARYAVRFLQAEGALVALADDAAGGRLRVAVAVGSLARFQGLCSDQNDAGLVRLAIGRERIEVVQGTTSPSVNLIAGITVRSAAVAPLRPQGVTLGALAVVDRRSGQFTTEDLWLLSTVAMQASVAVANGRLIEMLRRSTEEWETAFNGLAEGIAVVDAGGKVLRANRALAALAGSSEQALIGREFAGIVPEPEAAREVVAAAHRGERPGPTEVRLDRGRRVLRLTAAPLTGSPAAAAAVVLVEDVTEQRAMEAQLIQNEKMASIGQLVSGVAHELNNPLASIAGLAELLLEPGMRLAAGAREHLKVIHDQAERAGRIVRNLLTFARQGAPEKDVVDLNDVVARTSLLISYELKLRGIELDARLSPEPVLVFGDRYELQQVLLNLVTNAVQAVSELEPGRPRRIVMATARVDGQAQLRVSDTGPGVPPALVGHLFTPFFTTKQPGQGTGLGLSLSYGLVESHGGRIAYQPGPEGGAEFTVSLPLQDAAEKPAGPEAVPAAADGREPRGPPRVLVVDDDPAIHRLVSALFAPDGYAVESARTGEQGLRLARSRRYDLIIADARLPAGPDQLFVPALLAALPDARERLVVAGSPRTSGPQFGTNLTYAPKPFNLRDLRALAGRILAR